MSEDAMEDTIVGNSAAIQELRRSILQVAGHNLPVLIEGPTGTGKELVARALHAHSGRRGSFIATNVCAINESVFENELFGHRRGGYTGAFGDARGLLAEADRGTLFLDEIGGLSLAMQAKLLRAIETKEFRPVGGGRSERSDFRVVAATNERLDDLVRRGSFRADLRHRLGAVLMRTPALDARQQDIPLLADHFAAAIGNRSRLTQPAKAWLRRRQWPGNVRQLKHLIELACHLHPGRVTAAMLRRLAGDVGVVTTSTQGSAEHTALLRALERHGGNKQRLAKSLGVHVATVYRQLKRVGDASPA